MYFKSRPSQASVFLLTALAAAEPSMASESRLSFGLEAGQVSVSSSVKSEIDKDGQSFGGMVGITSIWNAGLVGLGFGFSSSNLDGDDSARQVKQDLGLDLTFLDLRYLYLFTVDLAFGPSIRGYYGKAAKHGVSNNDDIDFMLSPGLVLQYSWSKTELQPALALSYYRDVNITHRDVSTVLLSFSVSTSTAKLFSSSSSPAMPEADKVESESKAKPSDASIPVANADASVPTPPAAIAPPVPAAPLPADVPTAVKVIRLSIDSGKGDLSSDADKELAMIGRILMASNGDWINATISGHSDRNGVPALNKQLSRKRAEAVCEKLVKQSLEKDKLSCVGLGSEQLLADLPPKARAQRRVEISIEAKSQDSAAKLERELTNALGR